MINPFYVAYIFVKSYIPVKPANPVIKRGYSLFIGYNSFTYSSYIFLANFNSKLDELTVAIFFLNSNSFNNLIT